jgi:O-antigen ligase
LSKWGPGYARRINGVGVAPRDFADSEGTARVRPPALGSDEGFGGAVGVMALSGALVLLAIGRIGRKWPALLLCLGAVLAVATSESRTAVLGAVFALLAFAVLSLSAGRRATRALTALLVAGAFAFALASILVPAAGKGVFSRYSSISPGKAASTSVTYREGDLAQIPRDIKSEPFGQGLATTAAATGFGGESGVLIEGRRASAESQYNYMTLELGLVGLLLWVALSVKVIVLGVRRLRRIGDIELRLSLAAIFATLIAFTVMGFTGPTTSSIPFGPFFWFAVGIAAYWFGGERWQQPTPPSPRVALPGYGGV